MANSRTSSPSKRKLDQCSVNRPSRPSSSGQTATGSPKAARRLSNLSSSQQSSSADKRRRSSNSEIAHSSEIASKSQAFSAMYNFSSTATNGHNGIIDLTAASPTPSKHRRVSSGVRLEQYNPSGATKKLLVKNLRTAPRSDPDVYCKQTLAKLNEALTAIFSDTRPQLSNEELYKGVEHLCKFKKAPEVDDALNARCHEHVSGTLKQLVDAQLVDAQLGDAQLGDAQLGDAQAGADNTAILRAAVDTWGKWSRQLLTIRSIYFYLDRSYLLQTSHKSIQEMGVGLFRDLIYQDDKVQKKIVQGECDLLLAQRTVPTSDPTLFQDGIKMLHDLGVYWRDFEPEMLGLSQEYISAWSDKAVSEKELPVYVKESVALIDSELDRCDRFNLEPSTRRALLTLLEHHLIDRREGDLTNEDSVADLLDANDTTSLHQLFKLLQRRRLGAKLGPSFSKWINDTGSAIVFDEKNQETMVARLLELKQSLDHVWRVSFERHEDLSIALREAFSTFINKSKKTSATWGTDNSKPAEMIAKYVDSLLKQGAKVIPTNLNASHTKDAAFDNDEGEDDGDEDSQVNEQLDQVLDLFRFVQGKAVFEAFYKKDLARRLLLGRSASNDAERSMLTRLKTECGASFTQNLEQMFRDVELGREEMSAYKSRGDSALHKGDVDLNVSILSSSAWPSYPDVAVTIPPEIARVQDRFQNYYLSKHTNRKLLWKPALAHCVIRASFPRGVKEMVVSSFQAIVLLMFTGRGRDDHVSYEQIKAESGLDEEEIKRTLQSLACAKLRPLTKHPKGRDVNDSDTFTVNADFTHDKFRFKINSIQQKETKEENKATHERVAADRQFETQAAVVRIMKSRKQIHHQELIAEVISATRTRGVLSVADIKKNIDRLVEKEYMERGDGNTYHYLA